MSDDILSELERYNEGYRPEQGIRPSLESIPDGDYTFDIMDAELIRSMKAKDPVLRLGLRVDGGAIVERGYPLTSQEMCNRLGADLVALGFSEFDGPKDFSKKVGAAIPKLKGVRFRARKHTDRKGDKVYTNLFILGRVAAGQKAPPPPAPSSVAPPATPPARGDSIPF